MSLIEILANFPDLEKIIALDGEVDKEDQKLRIKIGSEITNIIAEKDMMHFYDEIVLNLSNIDVDEC